MSTIRVDCPIEGHEHDWVELDSANWTIGDTRRLNSETDSDVVFDTVVKRIAACHLTTVNGDVITSVSSPEDLYDVAEEIYGWFPFAIYQMIGAKRKLGNLSALASFGTSGKPKTTAQSKKANSATPSGSDS